MKGTIKKLNEKGYGFISPEDGGKDIFFHANDVTSGTIADMREGDQVSFEVEQSPKGPKATNVQVVG